MNLQIEIITGKNPTTFEFEHPVRYITSPILLSPHFRNPCIICFMPRCYPRKENKNLNYDTKISVFLSRSNEKKIKIFLKRSNRIL